MAVKDYQGTLRMQLLQLKSQRAQVLESYEELKRRIGLIDEGLSWDLMIDGADGSPNRDRTGWLGKAAAKQHESEVLSEREDMLTPTQLHEMAVLSRPHAPAKEWAAAQISDDRRQALKELLEENLRLQRIVTELRQFKGIR